MKSTFISLFFNLLLFVPFSGKSQGIFPSTASALALGGIRAAYPKDSFNPAHLAKDSSINLCLFHNNQFLRSGLSEKGILYQHPLRDGNVGVLLTVSGFDGYRASTFTGLYGRRLNPALTLGVGLGTKCNSAKGVQSACLPLATLGIDWTPLDKLGFSIRFQHISKRSTLTSGFRFAPNPHALVLAELELFGLQNPEIRIGLEYQLHPILYFRTGISTPSMQTAFGGLLRLPGGQELNLAWINHAYLGSSAAISLTFFFKKSAHAHFNRFGYQF